ncbi:MULTISPECIES: hypothetical protein [Streptomyces]|uniref:hypothetical protein n=1 Tax=Streptomyces TaxID=1883 RepID=UPI00167BC04D|nr:MULTISPECIES: hypothetical protein [Streptomyces]MBD3576939.1 hypothetical protein [Streptomyces sp. KD18]GGT05005.1 hypothetical protein GCM10010286_32800 [Streptomyces toxytricini]
MRGTDNPRSSPLVPDTVVAEISRHDWDAVACGCGRGAGHLVDTLWNAAEGHPSAFRALEGHAFLAGALRPPAPAVCGVLMAVWSAGPPRQATREALLWTLLALLGAEDDGSAYEAGLYGQCAAFVRRAADSLRREAVDRPGSVSAAYADGVLELLGMAA